MKNFKRIETYNPEGHGYNYDQYGEKFIVACTPQGWINIEDLAPDHEYIGCIQVVKTWVGEKFVDTVDCLHAEKDHMMNNYKFHFKHREYSITLWQPMAGVDE